MTRVLSKIGRMSLMAMIAVSLVNCAGRNEKQIEVQKRPATTPTSQPSPDNSVMYPPTTSTPGSGDALPIPQSSNPGSVVTPIGSQPPGSVVTPIGSQPPVAVLPPTTISPTPQTGPVVVPGATTNATITVTLGNGTTQQIQWDGLSDRGNTKWKIETVSQ